MASLQASWFSSFSSVSHSSPKKGHTFTPFRVNFSLNSSNEDSSPPEAGSETEKAPIDPVKLAFSKAKEYKKSAQSRPKSESQKSPAQDSSTESKKRVPDSVRIAMEKAKEYAKNKGNLGSEKISGLNRASPENSGDGTLEKKAEKKMKKKEGFSISSIDFVGLNFADKKTGRDIPAGLVPISDPFPEEGDVPEVEIIVGNANEFTRGKSPNPEKAQENEPDVYRPKVSTWGVFPRPSNISKTFGGGKTLKPGEALETEEERAAKDANTRKVITAYKKKTGIFIDPKKKTECEEVLKNGDLLMDRGKLKEASSYYEKVMSDLPFQSELHGLAALQWSICQDSLTRSKEARDMYEKLRSHPSPRVSKKARQFMFSFQAMEMMKVTLRSPDSVKNEEYENFFEAFVEKKSEYSSNEVDEDQVLSLNKTLPYILLLVSPIFIVLFAALKKRI